MMLSIPHYSRLSQPSTHVYLLWRITNGYSIPPIVASDPPLQDGDTYLNLLTKQEYVCHKDTPDGIAQWTAIGAVPDTTFGYRGTVET